MLLTLTRPRPPCRPPQAPFSLHMRWAKSRATSCCCGEPASAFAAAAWAAACVWEVCSLVLVLSNLQGHSACCASQHQSQSVAHAAALCRFGAPAWLAAICVAWGVAAACMALVRGPVSFVLIRMVLGLAESGAFPGIWYYISCWYAPDRTTLPFSIIETGITVSQVVAAPAAAGLLLLDGKLGLAGFQWLFIAEGDLVRCSELLRGVAATYLEFS